MSDEHQLSELERVSPSDATVPDLPVPLVWPPAQQNFRRRSIYPVWATYLLILLAFVLVFGGLNLIFYTTILQYRASLHEQATVTAHSTVQALEAVQATANTLATANAKIYASATVQAGATVTATALVNNATATATALGNVLTQATSGIAVFTSSGYHVVAARQGYFQPCFAQASSFSNFAYQVSLIVDQGNQAGIVFRANSTSNAFYLFYIGINGSYSLDLYKNGSHATTLNIGHSAAIVTGLKQPNQLAVIAYKGILYLYVNRQFIAGVTNSTLSSGKIGVVALDFKNPTEAVFNNAQVWNITSSTVLTPPATNAATVTTATVTPTPSSTP